MRVRKAFAAAFLPIGVAIAGVALSAGIADAQPQPGDGSDGPFTWCPGDAPVATGNRQYNPVIWDDNVCHQWWYVDFGKGNVAQNVWDGPNPPAREPTRGYQPPPPLPPGLCWPTGGSFIPLPIPCPS
ncbi:hypothetical protein [Mycobacterium sp. Z3061]|uniref:hypothetical protein n=1 Tax=Mycobacterium sp. Z3061 TaxID=3073562 RepID=UPI002872E7B6|nr:hypothetical protein [Mycobacterium sp. Z3061]